MFFDYLIHEGKFLNFRSVNEYEYVERKNRQDVVFIVAITENDELVMILNTRPPLGRPSLEFPAGLIDKGEHFTTAGVRELKEETGYGGELYETFDAAASLGGLTNEMVYSTMFRNATKISEQDLDENEQIKIVLIPISELFNTIKDYNARNEIVSAKVVAFAQGLKIGGRYES